MGVDPVIGNEEKIILSPFLRDLLSEYGIFTLAQIKRPPWLASNSSYWMTDRDLGLGSVWASEWKEYIGALNKAGIRLTDRDDELLWVCNQSSGHITAKSAYSALIMNTSFEVPRWWYKKLWKWKILLKLKCFQWMAFENCLLTWDNLTRRGWIGLGICPLCFQEGESIEHLFIHCAFCRDLWNIIYSELNIHCEWKFENLERNFYNWYVSAHNFKLLPVFTCWIGRLEMNIYLRTRSPRYSFV